MILNVWQVGVATVGRRSMVKVQLSVVDSLAVGAVEVNLSAGGL